MENDVVNGACFLDLEIERLRFDKGEVNLGYNIPHTLGITRKLPIKVASPDLLDEKDGIWKRFPYEAPEHRVITLIHNGPAFVSPGSVGVVEEEDGALIAGLEKPQVGCHRRRGLLLLNLPRHRLIERVNHDELGLPPSINLGCNLLDTLFPVKMDGGIVEKPRSFQITGDNLRHVLKILLGVGLLSLSLEIHHIHRIGHIQLTEQRLSRCKTATDLKCKGRLIGLLFTNKHDVILFIDKVLDKWSLVILRLIKKFLKCECSKTLRQILSVMGLNNYRS